MKVMCINQPPEWKIVKFMFGGSIPEVGDECTVTATKPCSCGKHDIYFLAEHHLPTGFQTDCFAILPEGDADDVSVPDQEAIVPNLNL